ncbi:MAG: hypothetical protein ABSF29_01130 [Tepidisphaeraceae bacterium]|jgi:hypothetical protein
MDDVQPLATKIIDANPNAYGALVVEGATPEMARTLLGKVQAGRLLSARGASAERASAVLAGLWLWLDGLEESHRISQSLGNPTGSFWHAIMHRREGDFSNSKYWYARGAGHPALAILGQQAAALVNPLPADKRLLRITGNGWNPGAFVDLVEEIHDERRNPIFATAVALQRLEWKTLFDYCCVAG